MHAIFLAGGCGAPATVTSSAPQGFSGILWLSGYLTSIWWPEAQEAYGPLGVWPTVVQQLRDHAGNPSQGFHADTVEVFQK